MFTSVGYRCAPFRVTLFICINLFNVLIIFGCAGSPLLHVGVFRCSARAPRCSGFTCYGAQALGNTGSVVAVHGLSCSTTYGISPDPGSNTCPLCWQVDS